MVTTLFIFFQTLKDSSLVVDGILSNFKLFQAFMTVLVTCKNEEDPSNNVGTRVFTTFLPLFLDAHAQLTPQ